MAKNLKKDVGKMSNYNHVTLTGNLVKDPEIKKVGKRSKTTFQISIKRYPMPGEKECLDIFNIVSWGELAEIAGEYLKKGRKVLVDGRIQMRTYKQEDQLKWITEVVAENLKFLTPTTLI
jgi:single-strand DNA-binding protein